MDCNGICAICNVQCFRGELHISKNISKSNENKEVIDSQKCNTNEIQEDTGLIVIEPTEVYTVKKTLFGKEKVVRVK